MAGEPVLVINHVGAENWLRLHYPKLVKHARVVPHLRSNLDIIGNTVIGIVPVTKAYMAHEYYTITMNIPPAQRRRREFTCTEMDELNARLYKIHVGVPEFIIPEDLISERKHNDMYPVGSSLGTTNAPKGINTIV